jgi:hypothetical protein
VKLVRQGKGGEVMIAGKESLTQATEPVLSAIFLALWAVAVTARMIAVIELAAFLTLVE